MLLYFFYRSFTFELRERLCLKIIVKSNFQIPARRDLLNARINLTFTEFRLVKANGFKISVVWFNFFSTLMNLMLSGYWKHVTILPPGHLCKCLNKQKKTFTGKLIHLDKFQIPKEFRNPCIRPQSIGTGKPRGKSSSCNYRGIWNL